MGKSFYLECGRRVNSINMYSYGVYKPRRDVLERTKIERLNLAIKAYVAQISCA